MILYHGSNNIIKKPFLGGGKIYNDYGQGFYCTDKIELAKEWACTEEVSAYVNKYELDIQKLKILDLSKNEYSTLNWLALLLKYRKLRITSPIMKRGMEWLIKHFSIDISAYDVIIGYRADDSYFSFARAFISNEISLSQLSYAMRLGKLGEQYVLKTEKAFNQLSFQSAELADNTIYYARRKMRDDEARNAFFAEFEKEDINGIYMRDIIKEEMASDDVRLR